MINHISCCQMRRICSLKSFKDFYIKTGITKDRGTACLSTSAWRRKKWSYVSGTSDMPLLGLTVGQQLQKRVEHSPDKLAMVFYKDNVKLTFAQLLEKADALAAGLLSMGISPGDRVGIWGPNSVEWVIAQYGTARAGIILVNVNPSYRVNELKYALHKSECKAIIAAPGFKATDYMAILKDLIPEMESKPHGQKVQLPDLPFLEHVITMGENLHPNCLRFDDVLSMASPSQQAQVADMQDKLQFDDPINIQFTSGTTGNPKGATLTHHNILNNSYFVGRRCGYHRHEAVISTPVPLYHCFGMVMASLQSINHGATIVFPAPVFDPDYTLQAVEALKCTSQYGVPTMFIDMLNHPRCKTTNFSSLLTGIMAGSPCPIEIMKEVVDTMNIKEMTVCYGSTELSPVVFQSTKDCAIEKRISTVGKVLNHVESKIVDREGRIVPVGEVGEVCFRGTCVMLGYWNDSERTQESINESGWYRTGDLGVMSEDGYCSIVGRNKDMIIRGGENVYPLEIEELLYENDCIKDAQVISVPDKRLGEEICVWIIPKEGMSITEQEVKDFCKKRMSSYKVPRYIIFTDSFPTTVTGKVQKFLMRQQTAAQLGLD